MYRDISDDNVPDKLSAQMTPACVHVLSTVLWCWTETVSHSMITKAGFNLHFVCYVQGTNIFRQIYIYWNGCRQANLLTSYIKYPVNYIRRQLQWSVYWTASHITRLLKITKCYSHDLRKEIKNNAWNSPENYKHILSKQCIKNTQTGNYRDLGEILATLKTPFEINESALVQVMGLVPSSNMWLPESMLIKIYDII